MFSRKGTLSRTTPASNRQKKSRRVGACAATLFLFALPAQSGGSGKPGLISKIKAHTNATICVGRVVLVFSLPPIRSPRDSFLRSSGRAFPGADRVVPERR